MSLGLILKVGTPAFEKIGVMKDAGVMINCGIVSLTRLPEVICHVWADLMFMFLLGRYLQIVK